MKSAMILLLAAAGALLLRRSRAAVRHLAWVMGMVGALLLPVVASFVPVWRTGLWPDGAAAPSGDQTLASMGTAPPSSWAGSAEAPSVVAADTAFSTSFVIVALWTAIAVCLSLSTIRSVLRTRALARAARPIEDPHWLAQVASIRRALGIRRSVEVRTSDRIAGPVNVGLTSSTILIPSSALDWPPSLRRSVLLHELAHVSRWDVSTEILAQLVTAIHWYNPIAWIAARRARALREVACDELVLANGVRPSEYAAHLHQLSSTFETAGAPGLTAAGMRHRSTLGDRVHQILGRPGGRPPSRRSTLLLGLIAAVSLIGVIASLDGRPPTSAGNGGAPGDPGSEPLASELDPQSGDTHDDLAGDADSPWREQPAAISGRIDALWPSRSAEGNEPTASAGAAEAGHGFVPMGPIRTIGEGNGANADFPFTPSAGGGSDRRSLADARPSTHGATGLSRDAVRRVVHQSAGRIGLCDTYRGPRIPGAKRRVVVDFEIAQTGAVTHAGGRGELVDESIVSCVVQSFRQLSFRPLAQNLHITYPVVLSQGT